MTSIGISCGHCGPRHWRRQDYAETQPALKLFKDGGAAKAHGEIGTASGVVRYYARPERPGSAALSERTRINRAGRKKDINPTQQRLQKVPNVDRVMTGRAATTAPASPASANPVSGSPNFVQGRARSPTMATKKIKKVIIKFSSGPTIAYRITTLQESPRYAGGSITFAPKPNSNTATVCRRSRRNSRKLQYLPPRSKTGADHGRYNRTDLGRRSAFSARNSHHTTS